MGAHPRSLGSTSPPPPLAPRARSRRSSRAWRAGRCRSCGGICRKVLSTTRLTSRATRSSCRGFAGGEAGEICVLLLLLCCLVGGEICDIPMLLFGGEGGHVRGRSSGLLLLLLLLLVFCWRGGYVTSRFCWQEQWSFHVLFGGASIWLALKAREGIYLVCPQVSLCKTFFCAYDAGK